MSCSDNAGSGNGYVSGWGCLAGAIFAACIILFLGGVAAWLDRSDEMREKEWMATLTTSQRLHVNEMMETLGEKSVPGCIINFEDGRRWIVLGEVESEPNRVWFNHRTNLTNSVEIRIVVRREMVLSISEVICPDDEEWEDLFLEFGRESFELPAEAPPTNGS